MLHVKSSCVLEWILPDVLDSHLIEVSFLVREVVWASNASLLAENADDCKLDNEWAWLASQVCSLWLQKHLGSVLESGFYQK